MQDKLHTQLRNVKKGKGRENKPGFVKQEFVRKDQLSVPIRIIKDWISYCGENVGLGRFPANSYLCMKMTPSKSSGKSSSELIALAPDWSEFERKYV